MELTPKYIMTAHYDRQTTLEEQVGMEVQLWRGKVTLGGIFFTILFSLSHYSKYLLA